MTETKTEWLAGLEKEEQERRRAEIAKLDRNDPFYRLNAESIRKYGAA